MRPEIRMQLVCAGGVGKEKQEEEEYVVLVDVLDANS